MVPKLFQEPHPTFNNLIILLTFKTVFDSRSKTHIKTNSGQRATFCKYLVNGVI